MPTCKYIRELNFNIIICGEFNCHECSEIYLMDAERVHFNRNFADYACQNMQRYASKMHKPIIHKSFQYFGIIANELPSNGIDNFNDYGNALIPR